MARRAKCSKLRFELVCLREQASIVSVSSYLSLFSSASLCVTFYLSRNGTKKNSTRSMLVRARSIDLIPAGFRIELKSVHVKVSCFIDRLWQARFAPPYPVHGRFPLRRGGSISVYPRRRLHVRHEPCALRHNFFPPLITPYPDFFFLSRRIVDSGSTNNS